MQRATGMEETVLMDSPLFFAKQKIVEKEGLGS